MEPDIMPLHSSSPPPLDDDNVEAGSEEEEFGGFSDGMPRTALHSSTEPPASLMKPASTLTPDFSPSKHTTSIKSSRSQIEVEGQHCNSEANVHLVNGYAEGHHNSHAASIASTYSREEDAGFADFTVFTEQAAHPWCCGFSPMGDTEQVQQSVCWPHQDVHSAVGLQFQWGGSHSNRTLLRCLGVDTSNRVFIGMKRQPVSVPAFASSLGMLEPTKDFVPTVCSPGHTAVTAQAPLGPRDTHGPSTHSEQEPLPSRQLDQSSCGLSSSQDGTSPR
ncbi:uncharacterized protein ACBR49_009271 [Aulostomus maculatus]